MSLFQRSGGAVGEEPWFLNRGVLARLYLQARERSGQDAPDDVALNVGQAVVAAAVTVGQLFVVEAHQVENLANRQQARVSQGGRQAECAETRPPAVQKLPG
jgi:hypothetical protein